MSTQNGYTFWSPTYGGSRGKTHIIPVQGQLGVAGEFRLPIDIVDLTAEVVYVNNHTREAVEGYQATISDRFGGLHGVSYYAQVGVWLFGPRDVNGVTGYENPAHINFRKPDLDTPPQALQLVARWEQLDATYESSSRSGVPDAKNADGHIKVNALTLGATYWATKHLRMTGEYVYDSFPDSDASSQGGDASKNRAQAPGNTLAAGINDDAKKTASSMHEVNFRAAVAF
jgi:hypothetical protein